MIRHQVTGIILAGGKNIRMGQNKAFLKIRGLPIIERVLSVYKKLFDDIIIVTNEEDSYRHLGVQVRTDIEPGRGALGGLYTGLFYASRDCVFCAGCDMPFLNDRLIQFLLGKVDGADAVVPRTEDGLQPLHAIYSKACLEPIRRILSEKRIRIVEFYPRVHLRIVDEAEFAWLGPVKESFMNVNTPEEWLRVRDAGLT